MLEEKAAKVVWGYQHQYRIEVAVLAERLFPRLRRDLVPTVFLVGIPVRPGFRPDEVVLDPTDIGYAPSLLTEVPERAAEIQRDDPRNKYFHSHPVAEERMRKRIRWQAVGQAVEQCLGQYDGDLQVRTIVCTPVERDSYYVHIVLQLPVSAFNSVPRLQIDVSEDDLAIPTSLLDTTIDEYFSSCAIHMNLPDAGAYIGGSMRGVEDILVSGARHLMGRPAAYIRTTGGVGGLFAGMDEVSSLPYERKSCHGCVVFSRKDHPSVSRVLSLRNPIPISNTRAVRKLLEITSDDLHLLSDTEVIYGVGYVTSEYDQSAEDIYTVRFVSPHSWHLEHAGTALMQVKRGIPCLPAPRLDTAKLTDTLERVFAGDGNVDLSSIASLAEAATRQAKGTIMVVASDGRTESDRLSGESLTVEPVRLTPELLSTASSVDGAILLDTTGMCHGIGVILDGVATSGGDPARGARFNSALRYIGNPRDKRVALVVSEDGMINILPDLRPRIPASLIPSLIGELEDISGLEAIPWGRYHRAMHNLQRLGFYLTEADCGRVNELWHSIDGRIVLGEDTNIKPLYEDFKPLGMVDDSYFLDG